MKNHVIKKIQHYEEPCYKKKYNIMKNHAIKKIQHYEEPCYKKNTTL